MNYKTRDRLELAFVSLIMLLATVWTIAYGEKPHQSIAEDKPQVPYDAIYLKGGPMRGINFAKSGSAKINDTGTCISFELFQSQKTHTACNIDFIYWKESPVTRRKNDY